MSTPELPPLVDESIVTYANRVAQAKSTRHHRREFVADSGVWAPLGRAFVPNGAPNLEPERLRRRHLLLDSVHTLEQPLHGHGTELSASAGGAADTSEQDAPPLRILPTIVPARGPRHVQPSVLDRFNDGTMYRAAGSLTSLRDAQRVRFPKEVIKTSTARLKRVGAGTAYADTIYVHHLEARRGSTDASEAATPYPWHAGRLLPPARPARPGGPHLQTAPDIILGHPEEQQKPSASAGKPAAGHTKQPAAAGATSPRARAGHPRGRAGAAHDEPTRAAGRTPTRKGGGGAAHISASPPARPPASTHASSPQGGAGSAVPSDTGRSPSLGPESGHPISPKKSPRSANKAWPSGGALPPPLATPSEHSAGSPRDTSRGVSPGGAHGRAGRLGMPVPPHADGGDSHGFLDALREQKEEEERGGRHTTPPIGASLQLLIAEFDATTDTQRALLEGLLLQRHMHRADVYSLPKAKHAVRSLVEQRFENPTYRTRTVPPTAVVVSPTGPHRARAHSESIWHALSTEVAARDGGEMLLWQTLLNVARETARHDAERAARIVRSVLPHGADGVDDAGGLTAVGPGSGEPDGETRKFLGRLKELLDAGVSATEPELTARLVREFGTSHELIRKLLMTACTTAGMTKEQAMLHLGLAGPRGRGLHRSLAFRRGAVDGRAVPYPHGAPVAEEAAPAEPGEASGEPKNRRSSAAAAASRRSSSRVPGHGALAGSDGTAEGAAAESEAAHHGDHGHGDLSGSGVLPRPGAAASPSHAAASAYAPHAARRASERTGYLRRSSQQH